MIFPGFPAIFEGMTRSEPCLSYDSDSTLPDAERRRFDPVSKFSAICGATRAARCVKEKEKGQ
jgi:hypothetical protein